MGDSRRLRPRGPLSKNEGIRTIGGLALQYPLLPGIMAVMAACGHANALVEAAVSLARRRTLPAPLSR
ncbi:MAG TPA: hypothetical protein VL689_10610 [Paraburkholderia sp.]|jgi:hypothetical protein|nr:hypothetical protein [Paraburkholderia sp.]